MRARRLSTAARAVVLAIVLVPLASAQAIVAGDRSEPYVGARPPSGESFDPAKVRITFGRVARNLSSPVFVTHSGDGSGRLFIVEQTGRIKILHNGSVLATPFLNIAAKITNGGERGLLGLAFHPDYATNRRFYVNYTNTSGDTVVAEYLRSTGSVNVADAASARILLTIDQPYSNHNGGMLAFGPDRYLYVGMGDGGSAGDPGNRAQNVNNLLGKILRIDVDGKDTGKQYATPSSNPFDGATNGADEVWSYGLRNPWRFSFDRRTGDLWIGDVGQNRWEEIDRSTAGTSGAGRGVNYGWRVMEGNACYNPSSGCNTSGKTRPIAVYSHSVGCSVTGGYVYRGAQYRDLVGGYLFGDYCSGRVWAVRAHGPASQSPVLMADTSLNISSFGEGQDGRLYVTDIGTGDVWQVVAAPR
ncbi:MAG TPA: PQQ-dependent sugar dehydrogenase [Candidatus Limnocylindrales bacterium]|nr:PQQ-dependent sugar dehydrogenase [Candidatus Limnocylindrales bacterium]